MIISRPMSESLGLFRVAAISNTIMFDIFDHTTPCAEELFFSRNDENDPRVGDIIGRGRDDYEAADLVILGCPQDEGVRRNGGRVGAAQAPAAIRQQFYKLTTFNIKKRIVDIGDVNTDSTLEETHEIHCQIVKKIISDNKKLIVIGGGNDISYPDGRAMSETFGSTNWMAINIDSHLDVRLAKERNSGTPYRQLLDEGLLLPNRFFEVGYQTHFCSPIYYDYIRDLGVQRISLELLRSKNGPDIELREIIQQKFTHHSSSLNTFFGFDLDVVRSADAPGTSAPSPLGLRAGEFIQIVKYAASLANTRVIEFSEVNPVYDIDNKTSKLVAIAMHGICTGIN